MLNVYHIENNNLVNGDGNRFVIWVQGCNLQCKGCWNKATWTLDENTLLDTNELFQTISNTHNIHGVTFSGGEPFLQAEHLVNLARLIKSETDLTIQIFTGYELEELIAPFQRELVKLADIIVYGRFDASKESNNQKVHYLTEQDWSFNNSDVEVEIDYDGNIILTGYPTDKLISQFRGDFE